jgi:multiple sugar transport system permease protein
MRGRGRNDVGRMKLGGRRAQFEGFAFVAPFLLLYLFLLIYPLLRGILLSFRRADPFTDGRFVGIENYARLAADPVFHQSMLNTFMVTLMIVPVLTVIALALALALNRATRGAAIFRGIFFSSSVLSVTIVTLIWRFILTPDAGLIAEVRTALGAEPIPFLSSPDLAIPALAVTTIWWSLGFPIMLFLAGLQQIPPDMYEAAALDRSSRWTTFWRITLPSIRRTLILVVMLQTAAQLQLFGQAQLLTAGGPSGASRTIVLYIYEVAFGRWELGYAAAAAELLFLLILTVTLLQYWAVTRKDPER